MFAVCIAAFMQGIPIVHFHGGEITEGAIDKAEKNIEHILHDCFENNMIVNEENIIGLKDFIDCI